ncbi:MAG: hypothetical protein RLZZ52_446 [Actinomycetota bacterium]
MGDAEVADLVGQALCGGDIGIDVMDICKLFAWGAGEAIDGGAGEAIDGPSLGEKFPGNVAPRNTCYADNESFTRSSHCSSFVSRTAHSVNTSVVTVLPVVAQ